MQELTRTLTTLKGKGDFGGLLGMTAYACLRSMPFRPDLASQFIDEYMGYLQFHSTINVLRDPPHSYISPSIDLLAGFEKIRNRLTSGSYISQFDFDWDITTLISRANDGHLNIGLCSQEIFRFELDIPLVSISKDGLQLPQLYTLHDLKSKGEELEQASPIVEINGVEAVYYLEANHAMLLGFQDPDARYNRLFPPVTARFAGPYSNGALVSRLGLWPGAEAMMLRFSNGTRLTVAATAYWPSVNGPMNYTDGRTLLEVACMANSEPVFKSFPGRFIPATKYNGPSSYLSEYVLPIIRPEDDSSIRGFYLKHENTTDVAVLQVPTFHFGGRASDFSQTTTEFLSQAVGDGKSKLILDLSGNAGGDVAQGFNLFRIFFPDQTIYSATRFRATELIRLMGQIFSSVYRDDAPLDPPIASHQAVGPGQEHKFPLWEDLFGPHDILGDQMSSLYAHFDFNIASTNKDPINGFGGVPLNPASRSFEARNIIIMTDGHCASTCAVFAGLMKQQGVRSIAFGGRPRHGPMQAIGGVKGGQLWSLSTISRYISQAYTLAVDASSAGLPILTSEQLARFRELTPPDPKNFSVRFNTYDESTVNFRNAYAEGDDLTPLQFVYEAADCRLFFTADNHIHPETTWVVAARAMFLDGKCIKGSTPGTGG
ncbi:peptidase S41 family protein [Hypoxylon rubiginosum]|uniref:Peptidase S41 family protein n=1 Tax=Hypoxylon rubiginosum TaxID=110542 RepID=A0ACB9YUY4_9PEZI|nr:peptidase S41 family protein [Hypoxylon rubiginosum]